MDDITVDVDVLTPAEALGEREILRQLDASRDMFGGLVPAALHHAAVSLGLSTRQTRRRLEAFLGV